MREPDALARTAVEELRAKVEQCYGPEALRELLPSAAAAAEAAEGALTSRRTTVGGGGDSTHPGEAERLVLAALLVLLHQGGGYQISFTLRELTRLLGWPVAESSWEAVTRALEMYMQPVRHEYDTVSPAGMPEARVTSWRRLVAGYDYSDETEDGVPETASLAGRQITVTFNPDMLPRLKEASSLS